MEKKSQHTHSPEFAEVRQMLKEITESLKETDRIVQETAISQKETDRKMQETDRQIKESQQEVALQMKETERLIKESQQKTDLQMQETDRRFKAIQQEIGGISNSNGEFAEEYFYNTFDNGEPLEFAGEHFDAIDRNIEACAPQVKERDEYDIVLFNGSKLAIIETKYKSRESNIEDVIKKADSFRRWYPKYRNHKVYLGLAALTFDKKTTKKAQEKGIALIRQRGGKTVVYDKGLKAY